MLNTYEEKILNSIIKICISNKSNILFKKYNILTLIVNNNCNKIDIKNSIYKIFNLKIKKINIINIKKNKKNKLFNKNIHFKKAYVYLKKEQYKLYSNIIKEINK